MIPETIIAKIEDKKIPIDGQIELTWRCNQKCIHCYQYAAEDRELNTEEIKDILSQLARAGTLYISFTGGEPLVRKDFWEIAEYAARLHFALTLQTNATLISRETARRLEELNFFAVHVSLLGATAKTHDSITVNPGSFKKVLKAIKLLQQKRVRVILNITLLKQNFNEFYKMLKLKERLGENLDMRVSPYIFPRNDGSSENKELQLDDSQLREFFLWLKKDLDSDPWQGAGLLCNLGINNFAINARAEVYPCVSIPLVIGDLRQHSFKEIWAENSLLQRIRNIGLNDLDECQGCNLKSSCFRCSGLAYLEKKNICKAASETCRFTKILKEAKTYAEEKV